MQQTVARSVQETVIFSSRLGSRCGARRDETKRNETKRNGIERDLNRDGEFAHGVGIAEKTEGYLGRRLRRNSLRCLLELSDRSCRLQSPGTFVPSLSTLLHSFVHLPSTREEPIVPG